MDKSGVIRLSNDDNMRAIDLMSIQMVFAQKHNKAWTINVKIDGQQGMIPLAEYDTKEDCEQDFNAICEKRWGSE